MEFEEKKIDTLTESTSVNYIEISDKGELVESFIPKADVYISSDSVGYLLYDHVRKHILQNYGRFVGVISSGNSSLRSKRIKTAKMILGVIEK